IPPGAPRASIRSRRFAMSDASLVLDGLVRTFHQAGNTLEVLRGASLTVKAGELVALTAPSGAGKSTLLHIAGLLEEADGGEVRLGGKDTSRMDDGERTATRRKYLGFVYQFHYLLPEFSALENVMIPMMVDQVPRAEARQRASELLGRVGLSARETHRPARL